MELKDYFAKVVPDPGSTLSQSKGTDQFTC